VLGRRAASRRRGARRVDQPVGRRAHDVVAQLLRLDDAVDPGCRVRAPTGVADVADPEDRTPGSSFAAARASPVPWLQPRDAQGRPRAPVGSDAVDPRRVAAVVDSPEHPLVPAAGRQATRLGHRGSAMASTRVGVGVAEPPTAPARPEDPDERDERRERERRSGPQGRTEAVTAGRPSRSFQCGRHAPRGGEFDVVGREFGARRRSRTDRTQERVARRVGAVDELHASTR
jgi:hypothetical protein